MKKHYITIFLAYLLPVVVWAQISRFDNDKEAWYANIDAIGNQVIFDPSFGNPAPSVYAEDSNTGLPWYFVAPPCFLGDRSYAYEDTIKYDIYIPDYGTTNYTNDISFIGNGGQRMVHNHAMDPLVNVWTTYAVPLKETFWHLNNGNGPNPSKAQFLAILSDIENLEIRGEYKTGYDKAWLDNVWMGDVPEEFHNKIICEGESVQIGNYTHSVAGTYLDELEAVNGCDSVLYTLYLTVLPKAEAFDIAQICPGQDYVLPDGSITNQGGFYPFTYQAANGCDSILTLQVAVVPVIETAVNDYFCEGSLYLLPDGSTTDQVGNYEFSYQSTFGCDSVVRLELGQAFRMHTDLKFDLCVGETYMLPDGSITDQAGQYEFAYTTYLGCDSTIMVEIMARDTAYSVQRDTICNGETYLLPNGVSAGQKGVYPILLNTPYGCDSTIVVDLEVLDSSLTALVFSRCQLDFVALPDGSIAEESGTYIFKYPLSWGCDSTVVFDIKYHPTFDTLIEVQLPEGTFYTLPDGKTVVDTTFNAFYNFKTGFDCDSSVALRIDYVYYDIYAPNVFHPNLDGQNDFFTLYGNDDLLSILELRIYDRWGEEVFYKSNFDGNQDALGWDGNHRGKAMNPGVFVWKAQVEFVNGQKFVLQGDVTLIR